MESRLEIVDRINGLRKRLAILEEDATDESRTPEQLEEIDMEWEFVNDEIEQLEELLWLQIPDTWPIQELEEPIEEEPDYTYEPVVEAASDEI